MIVVAVSFAGWGHVGGVASEPLRPVGTHPGVPPPPAAVRPDAVSPSPLVTSVAWAPAETIARDAKDSDIWATTWADDGHLYTAYGDGTGFVPKVPVKLSQGLARIEGGPDAFRGVNVRSATFERFGNGPKGPKTAHIGVSK